MELSAEQFLQIVASLTAGTAEAFVPDQRRQPRAGFRAKASIIPLSEGSHPSAVTVEVRDISSSGIGFLLDRKMALDEQFALVLPRENDTPSVVLCAVAFWQPLTKDLYAIGGRFRRVLRDGGETPLPITTETSAANLATDVERLHRIAS